ncbi:hypothetical protein ID866_2088 [Astraeus odoratus]|nr:hypothetical protein ID866_2088 [Astraeus odoratus]
MPVLMLLLVGLNINVWARERINYAFIFELDLKSRMDPRKYFEVCLPRSMENRISQYITTDTFSNFMRLGLCVQALVFQLRIPDVVALDLAGFCCPGLVQPYTGWSFQKRNTLLC